MRVDKSTEVGGEDWVRALVKTDAPCLDQQKGDFFFPIARRPWHNASMRVCVESDQRGSSLPRRSRNLSTKGCLS